MSFGSYFFNTSSFYILLFGFLALYPTCVVASDASNVTLLRGLTLTAEQQDIIIRVRVSMSILSLVGTLFIIFSFFLFGRYKHMSSHLVLALTFVSLMEGVADLLSIVNVEINKEACYAQGILLQFSQNGIFAWTTVIALNLYLVVCWNWPTNNLEVIYHAVVWTWTCFVTFVPIAGQAYGEAGLWCWFTRTNGQPYRWIFFYVPLILQFIVVIVFYGLIIKSIRERINRVQDSTTEDSEMRAKRLLTRLRIYPLITLGLYIFPLINRLYDISSTVDSFFLYLMQSLTAPAMGLAVAIAYGLDDEMRLLWKDFLKDHFGFCKKCCSSAPDGDYVSSSSEDVVEFSHSESEQSHVS